MQNLLKEIKGEQHLFLCLQKVSQLKLVVAQLSVRYSHMQVQGNFIYKKEKSFDGKKKMYSHTEHQGEKWKWSKNLDNKLREDMKLSGRFTKSYWIMLALGSGNF